MWVSIPATTIYVRVLFGVTRLSAGADGTLGRSALNANKDSLVANRIEFELPFPRPIARVASGSAL
ncbi:hypothetical protein GCM10009784_29310 [Arthrobacter parietis]|uniref:Uncharacterized protein n=1 Tax=Arthrobacter parietis TaxID=271434 RepID=A0ABP5MRL6_9MICC